jgi:hypothetical protein
MTTEELAAVGLPAKPEIQDQEIAQPPEGHTSPAASGSGIREDGEIRSEVEEIGDVDADVKDLIAAKQSGPLPPSFVFGESKVTANLIREYEAAGFFLREMDALRWINKFLLPKRTKLSYFVTSSLVD